MSPSAENKKLPEDLTLYYQANRDVMTGQHKCRPVRTTWINRPTRSRGAIADWLHDARGCEP